MGQRSIRFPDEFEARLAALAEADGRTFSNYVLRMLEKALGDRPSAGHPAKPREVAGSTPAAPAPPRTPAMPKVVSGEVTFNETYTKPGSQRLGKGFVPPRPKGT